MPCPISCPPSLPPCNDLDVKCMSSAGATLVQSFPSTGRLADSFQTSLQTCAWVWHLADTSLEPSDWKGSFHSSNAQCIMYKTFFSGQQTRGTCLGSSPDTMQGDRAKWKQTINIHSQLNGCNPNYSPEKSPSQSQFHQPVHLSNRPPTPNLCCTQTIYWTQQKVPRKVNSLGSIYLTERWESL